MEAMLPMLLRCKSKVEEEADLHGVTAMLTWRMPLNASRRPALTMTTMSFASQLPRGLLQTHEGRGGYSVALEEVGMPCWLVKGLWWQRCTR